MNGLVFRLPLVCLVGMGLVACAAGEEAGPRGKGAMDAPGGSDASAQGPLQLGDPLQDPSITVTSDDDNDDNDDNDDGDVVDDTQCDCDAVPPGVSVDVGEGGIKVVIDIPGADPITISTTNGTCATSSDGVSIDGDLSVDLGGSQPLELADAALDLVIGGGMPIITGTAQIPGKVLDGIGCGCSDDSLPVDISLTRDAGLGIGADLALELALPNDSAIIDTSALPFGVGAVAIADADVTLLANGEHDRLEVAGTVAANATLWSDALPLTADGNLEVLAILDEQTPVLVQVMGAIDLEGGELTSGLTPLRSLKMPNAWLSLDNNGAELHATANASAHPLFRIEGRALVDARFTPSTWSLKVCADVMTDIVSASVMIGQCVDSVPDGSIICNCHRDDEGNCDGDDDGDSDDLPSEH